MEEDFKDEAENRQELPSLQIRGQSQLSGNAASNGPMTLSPTNANRNRILEMDQQLESRQNGFQLSDDLLTPLSPDKKNKLGQSQVKA